MEISKLSTFKSSFQLKNCSFGKLTRWMIFISVMSDPTATHSCNYVKVNWNIERKILSSRTTIVLSLPAKSCAAVCTDLICEYLLSHSLHIWHSSLPRDYYLRFISACATSGSLTFLWKVCSTSMPLILPAQFIIKWNLQCISPGIPCIWNCVTGGSPVCERGREACRVRAPV